MYLRSSSCSLLTFVCHSSQFQEELYKNVSPSKANLSWLIIYTAISRSRLAGILLFIWIVVVVVVDALEFLPLLQKKKTE